MSENTPVPVGVPQTPTKAQVGAIITAVGGILTALVAALPENDKVQLWGGIILGLLTVLANAYGVYKVPNKAKVPVARRRMDVGAVNLVGAIVTVIVVIVLVWLVLALVGHRDHNGGHGNDWERHPIGVLA